MRKVAIALVLLFSTWSVSLQAIEQARIQIDHWAFDALSAQGFDLSVQLTADGLTARASAETIQLPAPWQHINHVMLQCQQIRWQSGQIDCQAGKLAFSHPQYGQQNIDFQLRAQPEKATYQLTLKSVRLAGGDVNVKASFNAQRWQAEISASNVVLEQLPALVSEWLSQQQQRAMAQYQYQGKLSVTATLAGTASNINQLQADWTATELGFSNTDGTQVAEQLDGKGKVSLSELATGWQGEFAAAFSTGQVYSDPVFVDLSQHPLSVEAKAEANTNFSSLKVSTLRIAQPSVFDAALSANIEQGNVSAIQVQQFSADLATFYPVWLQPFTLGTALAKLDASGKITASIDWQPTNYALQAQLQDITLADQNQRFNLSHIDGDIDWGSDDQLRSSYLSWRGGQLYAIPFGIAEVNIASKGQSVTLQQALNLPVFDGVLTVNDFSLQRYASGLVDWTFDGILTPISMEKLSQALGWPSLQGKLSGKIPDVRYQNERLTIGGALQMNVFDGSAVIRDLAMTSPFGSLPQLSANIDISQLDMALLTSAFDVGRISGRLDGYVHNLRLADWQPVQFDARLATPESNPGKRRISQKAVDNLTQIGGGATGMLSRSFLRFFDDFSYQRLGISCRLQNEVCHMQGIEDAEAGYYIVKGGGGLPPWINVVGYTRQVDWTDLIARLKAVQHSDGPVIQ